MFSPGAVGGRGVGLRIKFTEVGGPTTVGSDVRKIFEIISCKGLKSISQTKIYQNIILLKRLIIVFG